MIIAINYADWKYKKAQQVNSKTAIYKGKVDKVISYSPKDIDKIFENKNKKILSQKRGNGYWLWKPYFIQKTMMDLNDNDYLIYLDSGAFYINNVRYLITQMELDGQSVMAFELPFKEYQYTKRDVFVRMGCDHDSYVNTNQRMATMVVIKKTAESMKFVKEWLEYSQVDNIITDSRNHMGKNNYKGFIDNRHDQSIFSILSKKYKIKAYRDPSQFGRFPDVLWGEEIEMLEADSTYPQIIVKHGKGEVSKKTYWEQMLYAYAPKCIVKFYHKPELYQDKGIDRKKMAFLTDNTPIKKEAYGIGMYKVVDKLIKVLGNNVDTIIVTDKNCDKSKIDSDIKTKIVLLNKHHSYQNVFISDIYFLVEMFEVIYKLRKKKIYKIFIPLGADYRELRRAYLLASIYHMAVSVYIVDDFIEYQRKIIGMKKSRYFDNKVVHYLKKMDKIFVVSNGMKIRIDELIGEKTIILPLPYIEEKTDKLSRQKKLQVIFLGSINELYLQGIKDIAEVIDKVNSETEKEIKLLFTYNHLAEVKHLIGNYSCIDSKRIEDEGQLRRELKDSLFCFMPYSDIDKYRLMQNTSFPSKLIEYLSSACSIVIYGNKTNSAQEYFEENSLPQVIYGNNKTLLEECIIFHIKEWPDYSKKYKAILYQNHSLVKLKKKIIWYI